MGVIVGEELVVGDDVLEGIAHTSIYNML